MFSQFTALRRNFPLDQANFSQTTEHYETSPSHILFYSYGHRGRSFSAPKRHVTHQGSVARKRFQPPPEHQPPHRAHENRTSTSTTLWTLLTHIEHFFAFSLSFISLNNCQLLPAATPSPRHLPTPTRHQAPTRSPDAIADSVALSDCLIALRPAQATTQPPTK